jgi:type VI secretion system protein ImpH
VLALLGLLIQRTRTPEGLAGVVALAAPGVDVRVDEFFPTLKGVGKPRPLSSAGTLGHARGEGKERASVVAMCWERASRTGVGQPA